MLRQLTKLITALDARRQNLTEQDALSREEQAILAGLERDVNILRAARAIVAQNLRTIRHHPRRDHVDPKSEVGVALTIFREADCPLHINEVIKRAAEQHGRQLKRSSITPRITRLAREGRLFKRYARGVYGLAVWPSDRIVAAESIATGLQLAAQGAGEVDAMT